MTRRWRCTAGVLFSKRTALRAARPRLIHCSVSGYGDGGSYRSKKAYDLL
jgi:crotonobetainyl-CoA:carnitine CoA-transferase CaiB-like acyl-CoA transferase